MIAPSESSIAESQTGTELASPIAAGPPGYELPTLADLPKELGVLLASVGVLGIVLPGIAGAPALLAGGLVLWPRTFGKMEHWFRGKFPDTHRQSMKQVGRFLDDLDQRYPQLESREDCSQALLTDGDRNGRDNDRLGSPSS